MKTITTILYDHEGQPKKLSAKSSKSRGEVLFLFHKFMQNNSNISFLKYKVTEVSETGVLGKGRSTWTQEELPSKTPNVSGSGDTNTKFE